MTQMSQHEWIKEFPAAVTVCDADGIILEMNDGAAQTFEKEGGYGLVGRNLLDCHADSSREKLRKMMSMQEKNVYTIEKNGVKKLVFQSPWFKNGQYAGFAEISLEIPFEMQHFVRD